MLVSANWSRARSTFTIASHVDAGARQLALDDPALLAPESGRGPRAHRRPRAVRARRRGRTGARRGRSRTRAARTAPRRGSRRSRVRGRRPRARPCRSSGTARSRPAAPEAIPPATWRACWIATVASPGSGFPSGPGCDAASPITEISGCPGSAAVGEDLRAGRRGRARRRSPRRARRRTAPRARRPPRSPSPPRCDATCRPARSATPAASIAVARAPSRTSTPSDASSRPAFADSFGLKAVSTRSPASSSTTRVSLGSKRVNWCRRWWRASTASCPATSTPVGPPPITTIVRKRCRRTVVLGPLGLLEGRQDLIAQRDRVRERLERERRLLPLVVPEVRGVRAAGDDQAVVADLLAAVQRQLAPLGVDLGHLGHRHADVGLLAQHAADRGRAVAHRQHAGGELVEQRLEQVVVRAVDERDVDVGLAAAPARRPARRTRRRRSRPCGAQPTPATSWLAAPRRSSR